MAKLYERNRFPEEYLKWCGKCSITLLKINIEWKENFPFIRKYWLEEGGIDDVVWVSHTKSGIKTSKSPATKFIRLLLVDARGDNLKFNHPKNYRDVIALRKLIHSEENPIVEWERKWNTWKWCVSFSSDDGVLRDELIKYHVDWIEALKENGMIDEYWDGLLKAEYRTKVDKFWDTGVIWERNLTGIKYKPKIDLSDLVHSDNFTHFIERKTYEDGYVPKIPIYKDARNQLGIWIGNCGAGRWAEYFMISGSFMVLNGGTVNHLRASYGLTDDEIYSSLYQVAIDHFFFIKNPHLIVAPVESGYKCYYPNGFYGGKGAMGLYLKRRGMSDLEIEIAVDNIKRHGPLFYKPMRQVYIDGVITKWKNGELKLYESV